MNVLSTVRSPGAFLLAVLVTYVALASPPHEASKEKSPVVSKTESSESEADRLSQRVSCERLESRNDDELWKRAECYWKLGSLDQAIKSLHQVTSTNTKDLEAYFTTSWLLWESARIQTGPLAERLTAESLTELEKCRVSNPSHWEVDTELGDHFYLRSNEPEKAYPEYLKARKNYSGDYARNVPRASLGRRAAIENRIARVALALGRKGEAVEASCRALYFDPDDESAEKRVKDLGGSCVRKDVKDPREADEG